MRTYGRMEWDLIVGFSDEKALIEDQTEWPRAKDLVECKILNSGSQRRSSNGRHNVNSSKLDC